MSEREKNQERSIEEILAITLRIIQPVLTGDKREVEISKNGTNPGEGTPIVEFYPAPGVGQRTAREVIERLVKKLGADLTKREQISCRPLDPFSGNTVVAIYHYPTNIKNIVITTKDIGPWDVGYYWFRTWGIENLKPKSRLQKAGKKVREALGFGD